jgi:Protein of unknown function (DUF2786)
MDSPIIEKLRKLIAMEQSARSIGSLAEAEAFASKVQELLSKHKLEMSEVELDEQEESDPIDWEEVRTDDAGFKTKRGRAAWQIRIASGLALANNVRLVCTRTNAVRFAGRGSDREICKILFIYLLELAKEMATTASKNYRKDKLREVQNTYGGMDIGPRILNKYVREYKASWYSGFGSAVEKRFNDKYKEMMSQYAQSVAVVHIKKDEKAIDEFLDGKIQRGRRISEGVRNQAGYDAGKASGESVNLSSNRLHSATGRSSRLLPA